MERNGAPYDYVEELLSNPNNFELAIKRRQSGESAIGKKRPNTSSELPYDPIIPQHSEKSSGFEKNAKTSFSLSEAVEETKDLVAIHNIKSGELEKALELGGKSLRKSKNTLAIKQSHTHHFSRLQNVF